MKLLCKQWKNTEQKDKIKEQKANGEEDIPFWML